MREDWDLLTVSERVEAVRGSLLFIADPVSHLDEHDHVTLADYTLGELYHSRLVLQRLLPHLIEAADAHNIERKLEVAVKAAPQLEDGAPGETRVGSG